MGLNVVSPYLYDVKKIRGTILAEVASLKYENSITITYVYTILCRTVKL